MEKDCIICGGQFNPKYLDDAGKCKYCAANYPNAKNYHEALKSSTSEKEQQITLTEARVREIVEEEIDKREKARPSLQEKFTPPESALLEDPMEAVPHVTPQKDEKKLAEARERMAKARAARKPKREKNEERIEPETERKQNDRTKS